jgi:hypothetical protein
MRREFCEKKQLREKKICAGIVIQIYEKWELLFSPDSVYINIWIQETAKVAPP